MQARDDVWKQRHQTGHPAGQFRLREVNGRETVRERYGRGVAIIPQDVVRRELLWEKDNPHIVSIGMIGTMARFALDSGMHVIVEGILSQQSYGEMLATLARDHVGRTSAFYFDIPFEETVTRHATKPVATEYGEDLMRSWYRPLDLVPELAEHRIDARSTLEESVALIGAMSGLVPHS